MDKRMITNIHEDIIKVLVERLEKIPVHMKSYARKLEIRYIIEMLLHI